MRAAVNSWAFIRFYGLRETLQLRLPGEFKRFGDEELRAVMTRLAGPGVFQRLKYSQPGRAKDNSPAFQRWGSGGGRGDMSRQGRKSIWGSTGGLFRP